MLIPCKISVQRGYSREVLFSATEGSHVIGGITCSNLEDIQSVRGMTCSQSEEVQLFGGEEQPTNPKGTSIGK